MKVLILKTEKEVILEIVEEVHHLKDLTNPDHQVQNILQKISSYIINIFLHEIAFLLDELGCVVNKLEIFILSYKVLYAMFKTILRTITTYYLLVISSNLY